MPKQIDEPVVLLVCVTNLQLEQFGVLAFILFLVP